MKDNLKVGQKIKMYREKSGMSQFDLEVNIDASAGSLSRIESGQVNPTKETLIKIIETLNLNAFESAQLFNLDFDELPKMVNIAKKLSRSLDLEQVLQSATNEIVFELGLIGSVIFLIEDDILYAKTLTQSWYTSLIFKILNATRLDLHISLNLLTENLVVKCVMNQKVYISDTLLDFTKDVIDDEISKICMKVTGHKSAIIFPMISEGVSIGAILFSKNYLDNFKKEDKVLKEFVEHISTAIVNAKKFKKLQEEIQILKNGK